MCGKKNIFQPWCSFFKPFNFFYGLDELMMCHEPGSYIIEYWFVGILPNIHGKQMIMIFKIASCLFNKKYCNSVVKKYFEAILFSQDRVVEQCLQLYLILLGMFKLI